MRQTQPTSALLPLKGRNAKVGMSPDEKRECILRAAEELFAKQGYANTTMEQIVTTLGMTKPFVYYYFRNKLEIFETLSWRPMVECFSAMDFPKDDDRAAHLKVAEGLERLIRSTLTHYPSTFFPYREPQVYRPEYRVAQNAIARRFYDRMCALLEQGRADGMLEFNETKLTALAACSVPGFLFNWYRPEGRLPPEEIVFELTQLACRVIGLRTRRKVVPTSRSAR